ncbi:MAG: hypothetical protein H7144_18645 [Burkholderiales bacterium]|nr:hypothetical protein [Phycisphaerae bacterium]
MPVSEPALPAERSGSARISRAVSWRSVLLGLFGTVFICFVTPFNDYALNNTPMVGNNLPVGAVLLAFCFVVFINGPLTRFAPRLALSTGETIVAFSMMLVSCSIPSAGLLRYLPPMLVTPFYQAADNTEYRAVLEEIDLPKWIVPSYEGNTPSEWINDPLARGYITRWVDPGGGLPYAAWLTPVLTWAIFIFALYGALLCIVVLVRRQWVENERLAFPLAQIELALIEQPQPGKMFNPTLRSGFFWLAFGCVFLLHINNGLANYYPGYLPPIPTTYNFADLMAEPPWLYARHELKAASIYFIVIGATFFIPSAIAFSLWFFFILEQLFAMTMGSITGDAFLGGTLEQHYGSIFAFALSVFWVGRHHWALIIRQAFRGRRDGEPDDPYLPYPVAFWGLIGCIVIMCAWMTLAGCQLPFSIFAVLLLLLLFIVITRIVAEVGLIHGMLVSHLTRPWELFAMYGSGKIIPLKSLYITGMVDGGLFDFREVTSVYASHGIKMADQAAPFQARRSGGWKFIAVLALALVVGYFTGFYSTLHTEYTYAASADQAAVTPINVFGTTQAPRWFLMDPAVRYQQERFPMAPDAMHNPAANIGVGFLFTGFLAAMRLRFAWWPLHPVGYLMLGTFPGIRLWFSVMLGWIAKTIVVKLGGSKLYVSARPFFIGLIVGECIGAGFWMIIGIVLNSLGMEYRPIVIMPP